MANMLFMAEEYHSLLYQEAITILKFRDGLSWVDARGLILLENTVGGRWLGLKQFLIKKVCGYF